MSTNISIKCGPPGRSKKPPTTGNLLANLGRATRRGVKKCPGCGYLNGTKGYMCKNSLCNMTLKEGDKRKVQLDSVKLVTGTSRQIFSVRVRDKGPDHRGFVQLYDSSKGTLQETAVCLVDSCRRLFDDSILKCHENEAKQSTTACIHIDSALKSAGVATALEFKHNFISNLKVCKDVKQKLCALAKATEGPVVQSVSKSVLVVKCSVSPTNPLGYLHVMLGSSKGESSEELDTFYCGCESLTQELNVDVNQTKCIHYFACVVAFVSDTKFISKFMHFIHSDFNTEIFSSLEYSLANLLESDSTLPFMNKESDLEFATSSDLKSMDQNIEIEVLPANFMFKGDKLDVDLFTIPLLPATINEPPPKKKQKAPSAAKNDSEYFDVMSFNDWLSSVTERINGSVHYGVSSLQEPLLFHIPNRFYELLKDRIAYMTKLRHPTETSTVHRTTPPEGTFTKMAWHINNPTHLRQIFDTSKLPLKLTKSFVQKDGESFVEFDQPSRLRDQPAYIITYVKVGDDVERDERAPFVIEWTGNLFPTSGFGELGISFELGHKVVKNK